MYQMYIVAPMVKPHGLFAGGVERCATFLRTFFNRCESEVDVAPSQAYFLRKKRGVSALCHPMPTWICVDYIIPCPGVIDKEGADMVGVHSCQTITFRMMIASTHFFHGIKERVHIFILLGFKHPRDNQLLWRTGFFSNQDGVWEWVQVTCDHMANHYTALAHAYATTKASSRMHRQVSSITPPTECLLAITLPSALLSNKGGATTCPLGSLRNIKVHPGSSNPPGDWKTWEEYLKSKPGEFTSDRIVTEITQNRVKIDKTVARVLKMFHWYFTSRLIAVIGQFEKCVGTDNPGERWRQALLDFTYRNIGFDLKQLIGVLHCDLQVAIHKGLVKVQDDLLDAIANFTNNFHITVTMLSAPQVHPLLDHMHARRAGSHSFLAAVRHGTTLTRTESFLENGPAKLLQ